MRYTTWIVKKGRKNREEPEFKSGHRYVKLPLTELEADVGPVDTENLRLFEVRVIPHHGVFTLSIVLDT